MHPDPTGVSTRFGKALLALWREHDLPLGLLYRSDTSLTLSNLFSSQEAVAQASKEQWIKLLKHISTTYRASAREKGVPPDEIQLHANRMNDELVKAIEADVKLHGQFEKARSHNDLRGILHVVYNDVGDLPPELPIRRYRRRQP